MSSSSCCTHRLHVALASLLAFALLLVGCGDRAELWRSPLLIDGPHRVGPQLMWVDATRGLVFALEGSTSTMRIIAIRRNATATLASPNGTELLVVTGGKEAQLKGQEPEDAGLSVISVRAGGSPELSRFYPLSGAFNRLAVSKDGKLAVAYYSSGQSGGVFRNPNEVALVDLGRPADAENPLLRTVRSFGSAPLGVIFSPPMSPIGTGSSTPTGVTRTLAVVLADNYLTLLDLTHPTRKEITVPLARPEAPGTIRPQQVFFSASTGTVFVRADGAADIYSLTLREKKPEGPTDNDYLPSINQPSAGWPPQDMILFSDSGQDMILTANGTLLAVIDAQTGEFATIAISETVDAILAVPPDAPRLALIYSKQTPRARVHFLELKDVRLGLSKNLTSRNLDKPVHQLVAMPDGQQALVVHDDQRTVVSILDLVGANHTVSPIQGTLALTSFDFLQGAGGSYLVGVSPGLDRVGVLDLANLHPLEVRLDHDPRRVFAVGEALVVDHGALSGLVTVVPGARATREQSRVLWGFFLDGLLDRELKD